MPRNIKHRRYTSQPIPYSAGRFEQEPQIGIALSGGGIRAAVFHLGMLSQLASAGLLEKITALSTVSGGSLIAGLIFSVAGGGWPTSQFFLDECISVIRDRLTSPYSIQRDLVASFAWRPWQIRTRSANHLAESIGRCWGIEGTLNELTQTPRWIINATTYETGKNWRFTPHRSMGDYEIGYVSTPNLRIADAIAASAAVPGLVGPYILDCGQYEWFTFTRGEKRPTSQNIDKIHLWDGSVYDFLGAEPLFKMSTNPFPADVNMLIVSDAAQPLNLASGKSPIYHRAHRLVTIATDQVRSLRTRSMVNYFQQNPGSGAFLKIGTTAEKILTDWHISPAVIEEVGQPTINRRDAEWAASMETTLRQITDNEFELIFQHGWEVARYSLHHSLSNLQEAPLHQIAQTRSQYQETAAGKASPSVHSGIASPTPNQLGV